MATKKRKPRRRNSAADDNAAPPKLRPLSPRQQRFVDEYLLDLNATAAYIRAGYKATGNAAEVGASQLLRNPKIAAEVEKRINDRKGRTEVDQDTVIAGLHKEAKFNGEGSSHLARIRAWELLGKHVGLKFSDKVQVSGDPANPVKVEHGGAPSLLDRIDTLAGAFAGAADRASAGGVPGDGDREPVDPGLHQGGADPKAG